MKIGGSSTRHYSVKPVPEGEAVIKTGYVDKTLVLQKLILAVKHIFVELPTRLLNSLIHRLIRSFGY